MAGALAAVIRSPALALTCILTALSLGCPAGLGVALVVPAGVRLLAVIVAVRCSARLIDRLIGFAVTRGDAVGLPAIVRLLALTLTLTLIRLLAAFVFTGLPVGLGRGASIRFARRLSRRLRRLFSGVGPSGFRILTGLIIPCFRVVRFLPALRLTLLLIRFLGAVLVATGILASRRRP